MPRGNDPEAQKTFRSDTQAQYGIYPNADEMIRAHRAALDPAVTRASLVQIDEEATKEAQQDLAAAASKAELKDTDTVLGVAVRGNALSIVYVDQDGWTHKTVTGWTDQYESPELTPAEEAIRAEARRDAIVRAETTRLQAEADAQIAEAKAEADAKVAEEVAKIQEEAQAEVEAAHEAAAEEAEEPTPAQAKAKAGGAKKPAVKKE
jgi:hypothetical protein